MNFNQKMKKSGRTASLKITLVDKVPVTHFKNENKF